MLKITPLPTTIEESFAYARKDGRIVAWAPYGQHIELTCRNHLNLRWSTKNIDGIGSRTIFFDLGGKIKLPECACKMSELIPHVPDDWENKIHLIPIIRCTYCDEKIMEANTMCSGGMICTPCHDIGGSFGDKVADEVMLLAAERGVPVKSKGHIAFDAMNIVKEVIRSKRGIK